MKRKQILIAIIIFVATFLLYQSMAPEKLSSANLGSDGGDYLAAVLTRGIPHPTGYPLYLILSDFFQSVFTRTAVWNQAQLSVIPGALAVTLFFYLTFTILNKTNLKGPVHAGVIASAALAISPLFWSQAVIIEVYALNALFFCLAVIWLIEAIEFKGFPNKKRGWILVIIAWVCGLGLGNHTTYAFVYPLVLISLWLLFRSGMNPGLVLLCAVGWLSGLFSYIIIPLRAQYHPPVNWGNPETWEGFLWLIKGGDYGGIVFGIEAHEYPNRVFSWIRILFEQFGIFGIVAAIFGIISAKTPSIIKWSSIYLFLVYSVFAIGYKTNDSIVYLIPSIIVLAIWISWGIVTLWQQKWKMVNLGMLLAFWIIVSSVIALPSRYQSVSPVNDDLARYAEEALSEASENEAIYPKTDGETFALWFYQYGLGLRPDVKIISRGLLQYSWYRENLFWIYPNIKPIELE